MNAKRFLTYFSLPFILVMWLNLQLNMSNEVPDLDRPQLEDLKKELETTLSEIDSLKPNIARYWLRREVQKQLDVTDTLLQLNVVYARFYKSN